MRCVDIVHPRTSRGIMGRGVVSTAPGTPHQCTRNAMENDTVCAQHGAARDRRERIMAARKNSSGKA